MLSSEFKVIEIKEKFQVTVEKFYDCPYCQEKFSKHTEYKIHLKDHHEEKCYRCIVQGNSRNGRY